MQFEFVRYDDPAYVSSNARVLQGLTADNVAWAFATGHFSNWHPLTWLSLMLDASLFGAKPWAFHATNLALHVAGSLLLFATVRQWTRDWPPDEWSIGASLVVAGLYALHPLHVESVAWISERKGILSTFFLLLCLWIHAGFGPEPGIRRRLRHVALFMSMALSLLAKQMAVTLPLLLLAVEAWPLNLGTPLRRRMIGKLPLFALAALFTVIAYWAQEKGGALGDLESLPMAKRAGNAVCSTAAYLWNAVWPVGLSPIYPLLVEQLTLGRIAASCLMVGSLAAWCLIQGKRQPAWRFGMTWFLIALIPVCGLIQIGSHARADRYSDVPLIGVWFAGVFLARSALLKRHVNRKLAAGIAATVLLAFGILSHRQAGYWRDSQKLFERAVAATENNYLALNNLGLVYRDQNRVEDAAECFAAASSIRPTFAPARINLANALADAGEVNAAIELLEELARTDADNAGVLANLGRARFLAGNYAAAEAACRRALAIDPELALAWSNLGAALVEQGNQREGLTALERAAKLAPGDLTFAYNLAAGRFANGDRAGALEILERILVRHPGNRRAAALKHRIRATDGR